MGKSSSAVKSSNRNEVESPELKFISDIDIGTTTHCMARRIDFFRKN
jgi:hypothetical protein